MSMVVHGEPPQPAPALLPPPLTKPDSDLEDWEKEAATPPRGLPATRSGDGVAGMSVEGGGLNGGAGFHPCRPRRSFQVIVNEYGCPIV